MSEEAKPVCIHCELPIHGTAYGGDGEWRHINLSICSVAQIREIDALRAAHEALLRRTQSLETALDQERADSERLRAFAVAARDIMLDPAHKMTFATIKAFADAFARDGVMDPNGNIIGDALLSGREDTER